MLGPGGLAQVARACHLRAEQTREAICALPGYGMYFEGPTYHEFVVKTPKPAAEIVRALADKGIAPGIALSGLPGLSTSGRREDDAGDDSKWSHGLLVTATELTTEGEIDSLIAALSAFA
jgi:glycine dehydrogenase subunit 1